MASCGQQEETQTQTLQNYVARNGTVQISGNIEDAGQLSFNLLKEDQGEAIRSFVAENGTFDINIDNIPVNEVYYLEIKGIAKGYEDRDLEWREALPVFLEEGANLVVVASPYDGFDSFSKYKFSVEGGGEEQAFLQEWHEALMQKRSELDGQVTIQMDAAGGMSSGKSNTTYEEAYSKINKSFVEKGLPLISTLYLISKENDHRAKVDVYQDIYERSSEEAQQSKYGIDLANRIFRITQHQPAIDLPNVLTARNSQLLPYDPVVFNDQEYLILSFWASWEPGIKEKLTTVEGIVPESKKGQVSVLHFSLDTKMSEWKPVTDELSLTNSYMLRAEVRQTAIDQLYLTELPRYMIIKPDGTIVENDIPFDRLAEVVGGL